MTGSWEIRRMAALGKDCAAARPRDSPGRGRSTPRHGPAPAVRFCGMREGHYIKARPERKPATGRRHARAAAVPRNGGGAPPFLTTGVRHAAPAATMAMGRRLSAMAGRTLPHACLRRGLYAACRPRAPGLPKACPAPKPGLPAKRLRTARSHGASPGRARLSPDTLTLWKFSSIFLKIFCRVPSAVDADLLCRCQKQIIPLGALLPNLPCQIPSPFCAPAAVRTWGAPHPGIGVQ